MRKLFRLLALAAFAGGVLSAAAEEITWTFDKTKVQRMQAITSSNCSQYLPEGWMLGPDADYGEWNIVPNNGPDGKSQVLQSPRMYNGSYSLIFYAHAGTLTINASNKNYPIIRIYNASADGKAGTQLGENIWVETSGFADYTVTIPANGYYGLAMNNSGYIYSVTNTWEGGEVTDTYTLSGIVKDAEGNALEGVDVSVSDKSTVTDTEGSWSVAELAPGSYTVNFSKGGYKATSANIAIDDADVTGLETTMELSTTVVYGSYSIPGVTVTLTDSEGESKGSDVTNAGGNYMFDAFGLLPGTYTLTGTKKYYEDNVQTVEFDGGDRINRGGRMTPVMLSFTAAVTGPDDQAVTDAAISLADEEGHTYSALPDGDVYKAADISAPDAADNTFTVTVTAPGYETYTSTVVFDGKDISQTITLTPARYSISGNVADADSRPLADVTVSLNEASVTTDEAGAWSFAGLPAGTYTLTFAKAGYVSTTAEYTLTDADLTDKTVTLHLTQTLFTGTVLADGAAVADTEVKLLDAEGTAVASATTDGQGAYEMEAAGLLPGNYSISAAKRYYQDASAEVTVADGTFAYNTDIELQAIMLTLTVTVVGPDGAVADATVTMTAEGSEPRTLTDEDADGVFTLDDINAAVATDKTFNVQAEAEGYESASESVVFDGENRSLTITMVKKTDGILSIEAVAADPDTEVYNLGGVRVDVRDLRPGIYIVSGRKTLLR